MDEILDPETPVDIFPQEVRQRLARVPTSADHAHALLETLGPNLRHPHTSGVETSRQGHMRELRVQHRGRPYRVLYAFDPRRVAILLIGGDKTGEWNRWYERMVPVADDLYDVHLADIAREMGDQ